MYIYDNISWIPLRMKNVLDKIVGGKKNITQFYLQKMFTQKSYRLLSYGINTKFIVEFPLQQWLSKHATILSYTCTA